MQSLEPETGVTNVTPEPGSVEGAVQDEINDMAAQTRPGLVAIALAMACIFDSPSRLVSAQPSAAKVLVSALDTLRKDSVQGRRGNSAMVKSMTKKGGA